MTAASPPRLHYLDGLRASLMVLGIPYHSALAFSGLPWLIGTDAPSPLLIAFAEFLHIWRMPTFFIVAGFFALMVIRRRGPRRWYAGRMQRLGIPLLFGIVVLSPIQWAIIAASRGARGRSIWDFLVAQWSHPGSYWTMHLWFLVVLLIYSGVLALLFVPPVRTHVARATAAITGRLAGWRFGLPTYLAVSSAIVVVGLAVWTAGGIAGLLSNLVSRNLVIYAPSFLTGLVLAFRPAYLERFMQLRRTPLLVAGLATAAYFIGMALAGASDSPVALVTQAVLWPVAGLVWAALAFKVATRVFRERSRIVDWLVDSSLVVYLVHQPLVLGFALLFIGAGVPSLVGFVLTVMLTAVVAGVTYELVNCVPVLRFLMTGSAAPGTGLLSGVRMRRRAPEASPS